MRVKPALDEIIFGNRGILKGIEVCVERECLVSAVTLVYTAIDAIAAMTRPSGQGDTSPGDFMQWSDKYLLPESNLSCTSIDLYAARCGVLHTYGPAARWVREGTAAPLIYEWRNGPTAQARIPLPAGAKRVVVEDLISGLTIAVVKFRKEVETDRELRELVRGHLETLFCYQPWPPPASYMTA